MNSCTGICFKKFSEKFSYDTFEITKTYDAKHFLWLLLEAVVQSCSVKKVSLEISKKFTGKHLRPEPATLLKKGLWHMCFPVNFVKFLRTPFLHRTPFVAASVLPYYSKTHCKNVIIIYYYKSLFQS